MTQSSGHAEDLYLKYEERRQAGEQIRFSDYCSEHPQHAAELQWLRDADRRLSDRLRSVAEEVGFTSDDDLETYELKPNRAQATTSTDSTQLAEVMRTRVTHFEKYRIEKLIGDGSMGQVFKVFDKDLRRHLAMKLLKRPSGSKESSDDPGFLRRQSRFMEEAQITSQLDHPAIVPVHDFGISPSGRVYFTMKHVKGTELLEVFRMVHAERAGWTMSRALTILRTVCNAMAYAHDKGVLHRDLKPTNVMVERFGSVYVMDWGLVRVISQDHGSVTLSDGEVTVAAESDRSDRARVNPDAPDVTHQGDSVGTPAYMAPEQARGELDRVGPATDVYGVGAMLYHLVTGFVPYTDGVEVPGAADVLRSVKRVPPTPARKLAPLADPGLLAIIDRAMKRDPADRHGSMEKLRDDISSYLDGQAPRASQLGPLRELLGWARRHKAWAAAVVASLAAAAVCLGRLA